MRKLSESALLRKDVCRFVRAVADSPVPRFSAASVARDYIAGHPSASLEEVKAIADEELRKLFPEPEDFSPGERLLRANALETWWYRNRERQ